MGSPLGVTAGAPGERHWRPQLRDPSDEMVLEAAVNGRANAIVTFNTKDFAAAAARFDVAVLRPAQLLGRIRS